MRTALAALGLALAACTHTTEVSVHDVDYAVSARRLELVGTRDGVDCRTEYGHLVVADGRATLDGEDMGLVEEGDTVVLEKPGRLFVNGEERTAGE